jgi:hypothetical protein
MAADPAAKPMATTKAFNLGLLGIIELLLMGRSTDTPLRARIRATQIRDAHSPPGSEAAKPCSIPHIHRAVDTTRMRIARPAPSTTGGPCNRKQM